MSKQIRPQSNSTFRIVLIIVAVALVLVLILVAARLAAKKSQAESGSFATIAGTQEAINYEEPDSFSGGKGLWLKGGKILSNAQITSELTAGTKVLEYYFDYTCNVCNDYEEILGAQMEQLIEGGEAIVVLRPTLTHAAPFAPLANNLIYWVAEFQPEKTWELQRALQKYATDNYKTTDFNRGQDDLEWQEQAQNPEPIVQQIAASVGIDYSQVPQASQHSGALAIQNYANLRSPDKSAGTPLYLANGKTVDISGAKSDDSVLRKATLGK